VFIQINDLLNVLVIIVPLNQVSLLSLDFVDFFFEPELIKMGPIDVYQV